MDLRFFLSDDLLTASKKFFNEILEIPTADAATSSIKINELLRDYISDKNLLIKIVDARFVGMINDSILGGRPAPESVNIDTEPDDEDYDKLLLFAVTVKDGIFLTKTDISRITRALNRRSASRPVVLLAQYRQMLSFSAAESGQYQRPGMKGEKIGRISILKDINLNQVHAGHERILRQLKIDPLKIRSFNDLYRQWQEVFNISILNKQFYSELFTWYLWAVRTVSFPNVVDDKKDDTVYNSENVIRLLTRLIFCWFVKEKGIISESLFDKSTILSTLKDFEPDSEKSSSYYKAILQNLFFATLNTEMSKDGGNREFIDDRKRNKKTGYTEEYLDHLIYRYKELFADPKEGLKLFENIPFLNGGLFECLDRRDPETNTEIRIDGFSTRTEKQPHVPNVLFFGYHDDLDLSSEFEDVKKYKHVKVRGIINILNSYKFTIEENTPLEQEIALDPELLGKIFENLLASYNPETRTTARKQTGSYYTPREIVNYMVDESLISYLKTQLTNTESTYLEIGSDQLNMVGNKGRKGQLSLQAEIVTNKWKKKEEDLEKLLRDLFAYESEGNPFKGDEETTNAIIYHLGECKILDPACGSGAFPMGILHKIVYALGKLDPGNRKWKQVQLEKAERDLERARQFKDESLRKTAIKNAEEKINYIEESFGETGHELDYTRKLFLIENCIYGVDIQQIAVQISKLRFFISLMVDQRVDDSKSNRNMLSLPNLETKFVAANTLIPVEKPEQLVLKGPEIEKVEKELHSIRQKIFFTRKYSEKKKLKEVERIKRKELKEALVKYGFSESSAGQVASWDPFDPLHSSSFFDSEIMFSLQPQSGNGKPGFFDIVVGNPPYVDSEAMVLIFPSLREKLKDIYLCAKGNWDLFIVFIEKGIKLLNKRGSFCYIIPNKLIGASYSKQLRKEILNYSLKEIRDYSRINVFIDQDVYPITLLLQNKKPENYGCVKMTVMESPIEEKNSHLIKNKIFYKDIYWDKYFFPTEFLNLLLKLTENNKKLKSLLVDVSGAATVNESYNIKEIIRDNKKIDGFKLTNTGTIDKYLSSWGKYRTLYLKDTYNYPVVLERDLNKINPFRVLQAKSQKIIIAGMSNKLEAYYDKFGEYIAGKSTVIILGGDEDLQYLLALLNSKILSFFINYFYYSLKMSGGYININSEIIENLPIPEKKDIELVLKMVNKIINSIETNNFTNNIDIMDFIVYKLYTLTYNECKIVDPEIEKLISREDYERMSIEELAEYEIPKKI